MVGTHTEFPSSDFAITSVNVPDRLDQREVDDRKQQDDASFYARRAWGSSLRIWGRRLLPYLVLAAVVVLAGIWLAVQREALTAERVSQRLAAVLHVPVRIQDSRIRTTPAPAIVLLGVDLGGQVRLDEVTLQFTAPSLWRAVMSGQRRWGDIVISPTTLTFDQVNQLLTWLPSLHQLVPDSVTRIRFSQLRFGGSGLLPDRYEASTHREANGQFASVTLRSLESPGSMQLQITPDRASGAVSFQCDAADWQPPFAPHTAWSELVASGRVSAGALQVDKFTLGSAFGAIEGQLAVRRQDQGAAAWAATGQVSTVGIDVATLIEQIAKRPQIANETSASTKPNVSSAPAPMPMSGTAAIEALLSGAGATPEDALGGLVAVGDIKVRSPVLNGINLGYSASHPSLNPSNSTASTRFTQFDASFVASKTGVLFRNIHGVSGALWTHGELTVTPEMAVDGLVHVNLGGARIQAPLRLHVRGTVAHPQFGR
jgi:hypothetical protein